MNEGSRLAPQIFAAAVVVAVVAIAGHSPEVYESLLQEDGFLEWLTAALFAIGGIIRLRLAVTERRPFDGLVAAFCLFVAGEEFSWGQRLLGYTPPAWFLAHNTQQEATLHNFAGVFGRPKWSLIAVLFAYGLLLPVLARNARARGLMERLRATVPPLALAPWFALAIVLLLWYPLDYTGEWVELMVSGLFLGAATAAPLFAVSLAAGSLLAMLLAAASARRSGGEASLACAASEVAALADDLAGGAATVDMLAATSFDRRVWSAVGDGEIDAAALSRFSSVGCHQSIPLSRRRYMVDPWGSSYWVEVEAQSAGLAELSVYSLGPNRRRDGATGSRDDVTATRSVDPFAIAGDSTSGGR